MAHDEEQGIEHTDEWGYAPARQGTFMESDQREDVRRFLPPRVGTGLTSISQASSGPLTRPASLVGSLSSNAARPGDSQLHHGHENPTRSGTRPNSPAESHIETAPVLDSEKIVEDEPKIAEEVEDKHLGAWLVDQFKADLFSVYRDERVGKDPRPHVRMNLAGLHRMRMRKLQVKLVQQVIHMRYNKTEPQGWEDLLAQYIEASKDYDYIRGCVDRKLDDPFVVISERWIDAQVFKTWLDTVPQDKRKNDGLDDLEEKDGLVTSFAAPVEKGPEPIGGTRGERTQKQQTKDFLTRLAFSIIGGIFLIAPMWLMVLQNTRYTALVTTTVSVLLWGIATAWKLEGGPLAVLSTTAAYAAVLVVFVGTNTPSAS